MIHSLRLQNFKPFQEQHLQFKPLTLLSGLNSSGKSSVLQALLLLRQSYQQDKLPETGLALNGDLVCIGRARFFRNIELFGLGSNGNCFTRGLFGNLDAIATRARIKEGRGNCFGKLEIMILVVPIAARLTIIYPANW